MTLGPYSSIQSSNILVPSDSNTSFTVPRNQLGLAGPGKLRRDDRNGARRYGKSAHKAAPRTATKAPKSPCSTRDMAIVIDDV